MQVPPPLTSARSAILAAKHNVATASMVDGATAVTGALRQTSADLQDAARALRELSPSSTGACIVLHAIEGLRPQLDDAVRVASELDPANGQLPIGMVDPLFEVLEDASTILFASRWG